MNWYYRIWVDAINYEINKNKNPDSWKVFTFSYMTVFLAWNIASFYSVILFFSGFDISKIIKSGIDVFPTEILNNIAWSILTLFIPSILMIYFLIFYKKRYEILLEKYEYKKGKLLLIYFFASILLLLGFSLLNNVL